MGSVERKHERPSFRDPKLAFRDPKHLFSDCCSHVLVQYTNDIVEVYKTVDKYGFAYAGIFTVFEREKGTTNERDHYKSLDGKYSIDYTDCGGWSIKDLDLRYKKLRNAILALFLMSVM